MLLNAVFGSESFCRDGWGRSKYIDWEGITSVSFGVCMLASCVHLHCHFRPNIDEHRLGKASHVNIHLLPWRHIRKPHIQWNQIYLARNFVNLCLSYNADSKFSTRTGLQKKKKKKNVFSSKRKKKCLHSVYQWQLGCQVSSIEVGLKLS